MAARRSEPAEPGPGCGRGRRPTPCWAHCRPNGSLPNGSLPNGARLNAGRRNGCRQDDRRRRATMDAAALARAIRPGAEP